MSFRNSSFNIIIKRNETFVLVSNAELSEISELMKCIRNEETVEHFIQIIDDCQTEEEFNDVWDFSCLESSSRTHSVKYKPDTASEDVFYHIKNFQEAVK